MKKLVFVVLILMGSLQISSAQNTFDDLFKEMEQMQKELLQQLENMDANGQGFQLFFDTLITQELGDLDIQFNDQFLQELDPALFDGMLQQMQQQLKQMDQEDWNQIEQLFKNFEEVFPFPPSPDTPGDKPAKKDKKKGKTYKI